MSNYLTCPHCGNNEFKRTSRDLVRLVNTGETIIDQTFDSTFDEYEYECAACSHNCTEEELIKGDELTKEERDLL